MTSSNQSHGDTRRGRRRRTSSVRWGALGAMLAGLGLIVAAYAVWIIRGGQNPLLSTQISTFALIVTSIGALGGVAGLLARQRTRGSGWLGTVGFAVAFAGSSLAMTGHVLIFLIASGVLEGGFATQRFGVWDLGASLGLVLLGVGLVILGVATLQTRVLPRWVGVVLVVAFPVSAAIWFFLSTYSGLAAFGCAWIALGYALWSERDASA